MGWIRLSVIAFALLLFAAVGIASRATSPEDLLIGSWEEVTWAYEKSDQAMAQDEQWKEASRNLIAHRAEVWKFKRDKSLRIYTSQQDQELVTSFWSIKGRGHILELREGDVVEDYQIQEITKDRLTLYFSFDLQVKGVVKMIFKRTDKIND